MIVPFLDPCYNTAPLGAHNFGNHPHVRLVVSRWQVIPMQIPVGQSIGFRVQSIGGYWIPLVEGDEGP